MARAGSPQLAPVSPLDLAGLEERSEDLKQEGWSPRERTSRRGEGFSQLCRAWLLPLSSLQAPSRDPVGQTQQEARGGGRPVDKVPTCQSWQKAGWRRVESSEGAHG